MKSYGEMPVLAAKGATGIGTPIFVGMATEIKIHLATASSASGTVKFAGSDSDDLPDFSAAKSPTNKWDYIEVIDNEDGTAIDGDTGVTLAGTDDHRNFTVNVDALKWFNAEITAWVAGAWTVTVIPYEESR